MVTAVAGTLGLGGAAIHSLERLPTKFVALDPGNRLVVNTSRHDPRAPRNRTSHADAAADTYLATATTSFVPVADRTDAKKVISPAVLARKPSAQTKIHSVTATTSKGTTAPAVEAAPHPEPIRALLDSLPWDILKPR